MILTRRAVLGQMSASAVLTYTAFIPQKGVAKAVAPQPLKKHIRRPPPRVHTTSTIASPTHHHHSISHHLHKHHKHRHHYKKHVGADNQRALGTLNTPGDRHDLALTMWGEARGLVKKHGENAMIAIGCVILNRVKWDHRTTGHGIHGVCHKHAQFSCWNKNDNSYQAMLDLVKQDDSTPDWKMWVLANQIAGKLLAGIYKDITGGATHYYAEKIVSPYWLKDMTIIGVEYGHTFCKEGPHHPHHAHHHHKKHYKGKTHGHHHA